MMARKILITGGAGLIGSRACKHFVAKGHEVVNLDKLTYAAKSCHAALAGAASTISVRSRRHRRREAG